jgi:DNA polymerase III epsilon subunit-like protein
MTLDHFGLWHEQRISMIDCETTGREPTRGDKIVEIAVVRLERLKVVGRWQTFLNPERPIPDDASQVHGIYDEDVVLAPRFKQKAAEFTAFCAGSVPCAYNESFDRGFVMAELWNTGGSALGGELLGWPRWLDPLSWVRSIGRFVVAENGEKVSNSLTAACQRYGVEMTGAHGALADATATALLLEAISGDMPRCTISELLRRQPLLGAAHDRRKQAARSAGRIE